MTFYYNFLFRLRESKVEAVENSLGALDDLFGKVDVVWETTLLSKVTTLSGRISSCGLSGTWKNFLTLGKRNRKCTAITNMLVTVQNKWMA